MKNKQLTLGILVLSTFLGFAQPATAQKKADSVEVMSTASGADPTGPEADNPAHGKALDKNGIVRPKTVTYTYFKKDRIKVKDTTIPVKEVTADTTYKATAPATDSGQSTTIAAANSTNEQQGCCCWGWLGLLGLLGLFGLKKKRTTGT